MLDFLQYGFMIRALEVGSIIAIVAPLIGIFLVLRRYSLIADTLSHVSLAGVAAGLLTGISPLLGALGASLISSVIIEKLRLSKKIYGESALSLFLSGSLALSIILLSVAHGFSTDLFNYLFGSILTVKQADVSLIGVIGAIVCIIILITYQQLLFITFDEDAAQVGGIKTQWMNMLLIILAAFTVAIAIPIVGILLISALVVIPVITALQLKRGFLQTLFWAEVCSLVSVLCGIVLSFYFNLPAGGTIVCFALTLFAASLTIDR